MLLKDTNSGARKFNGKTLTGRLSRDFLPSEAGALTITAVNLTTAQGGSSTTNTKDASITSTTATAGLSYSTIQFLPSLKYATGSVNYSSSNTAVATVSAAGVVTPIAAGTCNITITTPGLPTRIVALTVSAWGGGSAATFNNFVSGSLAAACCSAIDTAISGNSPGASTQGITSASNVFKVAGVDLTFCPTSGNGALVSPTHVLQANHYPFSNWTFVDNSGNSYQRSTVSAVQIGSTDISVVTLNAALPSAITPIPVLPSTFRTTNNLPQLQYGVACAYVTQDKKTFIGEWTQAAAGSELVISVPSVSGRQPWEQNLRAGDSGNPCFLIIGTQAVLLTCWHTGFTVGGGPIYSDNIAAINAQMGSESLTIFNSTGYPTY